MSLTGTNLWSLLLQNGSVDVYLPDTRPIMKQCRCAPYLEYINFSLCNYTFYSKSKSILFDLVKYSDWYVFIVFYYCIYTLHISCLFWLYCYLLFMFSFTFISVILILIDTFVVKQSTGFNLEHFWRGWLLLQNGWHYIFTWCQSYEGKMWLHNLY